MLVWGIPDLINGRVLEEERHAFAVVRTPARLGKLEWSGVVLMMNLLLHLQ